MSNKVRKQLIHVIEEHGVTAKFIARKLGWNYNNLINFKNGKYDYSIERLRKLSQFLQKYENI